MLAEGGGQGIAQPAFALTLDGAGGGVEQRSNPQRLLHVEIPWLLASLTPDGTNGSPIAAMAAGKAG
jgi:hypothetical protein